MYGIFMECWVSLKLFFGNYAFLILFLAAAVYITVSEKDFTKKILFGIFPVLVIAVFLLPVTKIVYVAALDDGSDTYYRILWVLPIYITLAYAACRLIFSFNKTAYRIMAAATSLLAIVLTGSLVYMNSYMSVAENPYHIPQNVIDIVDVIAPEDGEPRVRAAFPSELVHFVRQYDTDILLPFGREMVVTQWDYYNPVYEVMEKPEIIDAEALLEATRLTQCRYIILAADRAINADLTDYGLELVDTVGGYYIYSDPEIS